MNEAQLSTLNVTKRNMGGLGKYVLFSIGGLLAFMAFLMCLTIIGIIPGIGVGFLAVIFFYAGMGKQYLTCPICAKKQPVLQTQESFRCVKCRQITVVNWK